MCHDNDAVGGGGIEEKSFKWILKAIVRTLHPIFAKVYDRG